VVFGFFKKNKEEEIEEEEIEPVSFLGPLSGADVNLKPHGKLVEAGLLPAKDLVTDAISRRADTLRIEPKGAASTVTLLIDGMPYPGGKLQKQEGLAITQMLKLLAGLDTKQRKAPQSGGIKAEFQSQAYQLGVSSAPVADGERLTVRITDMSIKLDTPQQIGMGEPMRLKLRDLCVTPGVLAVVGPSGSGVSTTFYALVRNIDAYLYSIFTLCDTSGHKLQQTTAYEWNAGDNLEQTIARAARQEANVAVIGPLKDAESTKMIFAKREAIAMLVEIGVKDIAAGLAQLQTWEGDPKVVAEGLQGILTQKLIRTLCTDCRQAYRPKADFLKKVGLPTDLSMLYRKPAETEDPNVETCGKCGGLGYYGRTAMFELLEMSDGMKALVAEGKADAAAIKAQMKKDQMITMQQDGLRLVAEGKTSLEELQRVFKAPG
jgi:type II secretory ATPase GspE/PulE/Tfp pilus assembly ATPase PilB-like protein